jgi:manganese/zinc/iron transport system permease protein
MTLADLFHDLLFDYTLRTIALGAATLGIVSGVLGCFAVLRRQSLMGDALSHAALPGICLAFLLTGSKAPLVLFAGAGLTGWLGMLAILWLVRHTRLPSDAALGAVLTTFFGMGVVLLTLIQNSGNANQAGLDKFLFGQAATLVESDVVTMAVLGAVALAVVLIFYEEFKLLAFDPEFAAGQGVRTGALNVLLTSLLVIAVAVGLQTVGVVLMAAMLIAPAAAARQWTERLSVMLALAGLFGALAGVGGALLSVTAAHVPTGPMVILCATAIFAFSLFFAPARGLAWDAVRQARQRARAEQSL